MKANLLNHRFNLFSFLVFLMALLLSVSQILLQPKSIRSQSKDNERTGKATLVWKMTVTGIRQEKEDRSSNNLKNVTEVKDEITVITEGLLKFNIDKEGNHTNEETTTSASGSGTRITKHSYDYKETCGFPTKLGVGKYEDTVEITYTIKDNPKACCRAVSIHQVAPRGKDESDIYYELQDQNGAEPWLAAQYIMDFKNTYIHTNPCGEVENWTNPTDEPAALEHVLNSPFTTALGYCMRDENFLKQLKGYFPKNQGDFYTVSNTAFYQWTDSGVLSSNSSFSENGTVKLEYTLTYENNPSGLEVVIIAPDNYADWMPESGQNEATKGNDITISAELKVKGAPDLSPLQKAKFIFELVNTSHEKGVCLNVPRDADPDNPPDMKFDPKENLGFTITNNGQTATSKKSDISAYVKITSFDWGGYTRLKVTAITDKDNKKFIGHIVNSVERELPIPEDKNNNFVADAWEREKGIFEKNLPAEWNDIDIPSGQEATGDGISLYERYRGFEFESVYNPADSRLKHERLKPDRKYVFIYDPTDVVLSTATNPVSRDMSFIQISGFVVRFLAENQWSGSGQFSDKMRIVNFNYGKAHITDQHALHIKASSKTEIIDPVSGKEEPDKPDQITLGIAWDDTSSPRPLQDSPANVYLIEIFSTKIDLYLNDVLIYHTLGMPQFAGKDYKNMTDDEKKQVEIEATKYYKTHQDEYNQAFLKMKARTVSHELGHGLGIHHHKPLKAGSKECVMRYFEDLPEQHPDDRFELRSRVWPDSYCTKTENTWGSKGCRLQIKATDKGKR